MGSSTRKKKEKKKDFQKPKLRVGKTKAKPDNFTDTSFKAKSITITQQSLTTTAPSSTTQFTHYLSLASASKSTTQRRDALSYLTTQLSSLPSGHTQPLPTAILLPALLPLILDGTASIRTQLLKLLLQLPASDVGDRAESCLLYIRAGMTHLAAEIRIDALGVLEWLLNVAAEETVSAPGGWVKTLKSFMSMLGWATSSGTSKWTSASKVSFSKSGKGFPRQLQGFTQFLKAGLLEDEAEEAGGASGVWPSGMHLIPTRSNAFAHLNLFGSNRDEEGEMYIDREERQRVFGKLFGEAVKVGCENARKEGGETGRMAAVLAKVLKEGMGDFEGEQ